MTAALTSTRAADASVRAAPVPARITLGGWRLMRLVGEGRWTRVFRAQPAAAGANEAGDYCLKTLRSSPQQKSIAKAVLRREATVCRQVAHPQLVAVLDDHSTAERPFLVMPYLEGTTLRPLLHERISHIATALWIARQLAEGLAALHTAGWLHGDVRPENIRISPKGQATLTDLGLCRRLETAECVADPATWSDARYTSPEATAARGGLSPASDIYSLGCVLFEMLAGRPPFMAADPAELAQSHRSAVPPSIRWVRPDASREVDELLSRMLTKEPLRRPSGTELVRWLTELEIEELSGAGF